MTTEPAPNPPLHEALKERSDRTPLVGATFAVLSAVIVAVIAVTSCFGTGYVWTAAPTPTPTATNTPTPTPTPTATPTPTPTATPVQAPGLPPPGAGERWVDVNLTSQTVTAMVGNTPWHTALVTTGKDGWETPVGEFHVLYRVYDETMTSAAIGAEDYYVLTHVLFTQYFTNQGHALHLNYWRPDSVFGHQRTSHGCVGIRYADAQFLWNFANVGTRVVVHN